MENKNKLLQAIGIPHSALMSVIFGMMFLSLPLGVFVMFHSELGGDINYEFPLNEFDIFIAGIGISIPIDVQIGDAFIAIWVITSPLWLFGAGIIIPFVAAAYLNQRLFRYDALAEHASNEELKLLVTANRSSLWALGLLTGLTQFVPILNLFAPVLSGLAFVHFGLERLANLRQSS